MLATHIRSWSTAILSIAVLLAPPFCEWPEKIHCRDHHVGSITNAFFHKACGYIAVRVGFLQRGFTCFCVDEVTALQRPLQSSQRPVENASPFGVEDQILRPPCRVYLAGFGGDADGIIPVEFLGE